MVAKKNQTVIFECSWKDIKSVLKTFPENEELFDTFDNLSCVFLFQSFKEIELLYTGKKFKKTIYKSKEIILKEGEISSHLYLISKGRVKLKTPKTDKTFRVYDEGNCFGELSLLNESPSSFNIVASENSICYLLDKEKFFDLLQDQKVNDFIKQKMLTEDTDISLEDLYYISYLGRGRFGNVWLVHNRIGLYAAKAISKLAAEKQKSGVKNLINEKKCMISLDHPFIVKMVKTLKKDNWCFFLQEFISGKNFAEYLDTRKTYKSVYETKFFGANMFTIIAHLNKRRIIHRDIKPSNIMLDNNGYLKLIDFGTARKLKNFSQTVIGTPNFIAPEVLLGKGYSFPCDYWSIGICLYYIYSGILPFGHKALELMDIYKEIIEKEPDFQKDCPYDIKSLLSGLLCKKPSQRIKSFEMVQSQYLYKDFHWDDLLKFKIKPYYIPKKDPRDNPDNLEIVNSPFETFMESEKFETIQMQTLKIHNNKEMNRSNSLITPQWFNEF